MICNITALDLCRFYTSVAKTQSVGTGDADKCAAVATLERVFFARVLSAVSTDYSVSWREEGVREFDIAYVAVWGTESAHPGISLGDLFNYCTVLAQISPVACHTRYVERRQATRRTHFFSLAPDVHLSLVMFTAISVKCRSSDLRWSYCSGP